MRMREWSDDEIVMLTKKAAFIEAIETALRDDEDNGLDSIVYQLSLNGQDEIITVVFAGGGTKKILATGNSNGANAKEIIKAIYG